jgi:drug/metabolite transporter (DMT)-like permease
MTNDAGRAPGPWQRLSPTLRGALLILLSCVFFGFMGITIRELSQRLPTFELIFFRNAMALAFMLPWLAGHGLTALRTASWRLYFGRSFLAFGSMICWFTALATLPLAEAVALSFTSPLFATVLAVVVLHEIVRVRRWSATIIGFLGAMLILRPGFAEVTLAHWLVLLSSLAGAFGAILVKQLTRVDDANTIVTVMTLIVSPVALVLAIPVWQWPATWTDWALIVALGFCAMAGHQVLTRAYKLLDTSLVMTLDFARLPIAALLSWIIFAEVPDIWTWIGGAIIASASIYTARREAALARAGRLAEPPAAVLLSDKGSVRRPGRSSRDDDAR